MKIKKFLRLGTAFVMSLSSLLTMAVPLAHAIGPYTCVWKGGQSDGNFSNIANWDTTTPGANCNGAAPVAGDGDALVFPYALTAPTISSFAPRNDLTDASFSSLTFSGTAESSTSYYNITGNIMTLTGGITNSGTGLYATVIIEADLIVTGAQTYTTTTVDSILDLKGNLSGAGAISKTGAGSLYLEGSNSGYSGTITANGGDLLASSSDAVGSTGAIINSGADIILTSANCSDVNFAGNITLNGASSITTGDYPNPKLGSTAGCSFSTGSSSAEYYGAFSETNTANLTGTIALGSDATFAGTTATTTIHGAITGAYHIAMLPGYTGKLVVESSANGSLTPNATYTSDVFSKTISDSQPSTSVTIYANNTITIDGTRGNTSVLDGGVLKGTGTVAILSVDSTSTVAPGHSPGCLTSSALSLSGTYQAEIGGTTACSTYDQIKILTGGTVDVTNAKLDLSLYGGFTPVIGQSFTLIDNQDSAAITGVFTNLAEGATLTSQNITYKVTYKGGTGNDMVLTVTSVNGVGAPAKPNTGLGLIAARPMLTFTISTLSAALLLLGVRRSNSMSK